MGRLDLLDVRRDEDEPDVVLGDGARVYFKTADDACRVCGKWNRGTALTFGVRVCGRASCLAVAKAWHDLAATLVSNDPALD